MAELIGQRFLPSCWRAGTFRGHGEVILGPREGHSRLNPPFSHHMRLVGLVYTPRTACSNPDGLDIYALHHIAPLEFVIGDPIHILCLPPCSAPSFAWKVQVLLQCRKGKGASHSLWDYNLFRGLFFAGLLGFMGYPMGSGGGSGRLHRWRDSSLQRLARGLHTFGDPFSGIKRCSPSQPVPKGTLQSRALITHTHPVPGT